MYEEHNGKEEPLTEPDTENVTKFHPEDLSDTHYYRLDGSESLANHYRRLSNLNTGMWNGKWENKKAIHRADNLALFDGLSSSLDLTPHQKRRSRHLFDQFPLGTFGYDARFVAFAICVLVAEEDGRMFDPTEKVEHRNDLSDVETDKQFHLIALEERFSYGRLETVINKVRDRGDKWGWWDV